MISGFYFIQNSLLESISAAKAFDLEIARVKTLSQDAVSSTSQWSDELIKLSNSFGVPALEEATAAYNALSNQIGRGIDVTQFLVAANKLAVASVSTVDQSANLLASAMNSYGLGVESADKLSASFFKTVDRVS